MHANEPLSSNRPIKTKPHPTVPLIVPLLLACLSVLLGGPSVCRAASYVVIDGAEYDEPGASGPGWEWRDADTLVLSGYNGGGITIDGGATLVVAGENTVSFDGSEVDMHEYMAGLECVGGDLAIRGAGTLNATGYQAGILTIGGKLVIAGPSDGAAGGSLTIDARATGNMSEGAACAGLFVDALQVTGAGQVTASSARDMGMGSYGVGVGLRGESGGAASVAAPARIDARGVTGGFVAAGGVALSGVGVTLPVGGAMAPVTVAGAASATGVVGPAGAIAPHAVIAPGESGGSGGGYGDAGGAGTGAGGGGATEPTAPGGSGGSGSGGSTAPGGGSGSGTSGKPAGDPSQPGGKTPAKAPTTAPAGGNGSGAKTSAKPAAQKTGTSTTAGALPKTGDLPVQILFLAIASAAFLTWTRLKSRA